MPPEQAPTETLNPNGDNAIPLSELVGNNNITQQLDDKRKAKEAKAKAPAKTPPPTKEGDGEGEPEVLKVEEEQQQVKMMKYRLPGTDTVVEVPESVFSKVIEKQKEEAARIKAERDELAALRNKGKENKEEDPAKKMERGEFDKAYNEAKTKFEEEIAKYTQREQKLADSFLKTELKQSFATLANLDMNEKADKIIVEDAIRLLKSDLKYDLETGKTFVLAEDGEPKIDPDTGLEMTLEAHIKKFLEDRPLLVKKKVIKAIPTETNSKTQLVNKAQDRKAKIAALLKEPLQLPQI